MGMAPSQGWLRNHIRSAFGRTGMWGVPLARPDGWWGGQGPLAAGLASPRLLVAPAVLLTPGVSRPYYDAASELLARPSRPGLPSALAGRCTHDRDIDQDPRRRRERGARRRQPRSGGPAASPLVVAWMWNRSRAADRCAVGAISAGAVAAERRSPAGRLDDL